MDKPRWSNDPFPVEGSLQYEISSSLKAQALSHLNLLKEFILINFPDRSMDLIKIAELSDKISDDGIPRWEASHPIYSGWRDFLDKYDEYYCSFYHAYILDIPKFLVIGDTTESPTLEQELMIEHYRGED